MFYPGQLLYVPEEKKLGTYLAFEPAKWSMDPNTLLVYLGIGENLSECDTCMYEPHQVVTVVKPDKSSMTGQVAYKTPFQKPHFSQQFSEKTAEEMADTFREEMLRVMGFKWFQDKYEIDLRSGLK